jgi:hypothetical protein
MYSGQIYLELILGMGAKNAYYSNFMGENAGRSDRCSINFLGVNAGFRATTAYSSNFFGLELVLAINAQSSNFFGEGAGAVASGANNSNFFGSQAGNSATNAYSSNFLGQNAGSNATAANNSNFFGEIGYSATTANNSNFFGRSWLLQQVLSTQISWVKMLVEMQ